MHVLSIDVGSYSVKYISANVDRRRVSVLDLSEIVIRDYLADRDGMTVLEAQMSIVQELIDTNSRQDTRVIYQAENEIITTRFLTLPVKSKKKADLMLPFQLEEDIPYALSEIHFAYRMEAQKNQYMAMVELANMRIFEDYFQGVRDKNIVPSILTTESSAAENYFHQTPMAGPFCLLDIGHKTTKAYFFYNSRLLVSHVSYVGGHHVNEMIAQTYQIDVNEAIIYKHQNAFMLTSNQYQEVEPAQVEFAKAMDRVFAHLTSDFARWKVGFKVNYGLTLSNVYICGGSANIKNMANYLTEKMDTKVSLLETFDQVEAEKVDLNPKNKTKFVLASMMAQGFKKKNRFINLLTGKYAQASATELPLHSLAFIGVRVTLVTAFLALALLGERLILEMRDLKQVNSDLARELRREDLGLTGRVRRAVNTNPRPVYDSLVKQQRTVKQEISTLQSAIEIQALNPLIIVSQLANGSEAILTSFTSSDAGEIEAIFTAEKIEDLNNLKAAFERSSLREVQAGLDEQKLQLKINASSGI